MDEQTLANLLATLLGPVFLWIAGRAVMVLRNWNINATVARAIGRAAGAAYLTLVEERRGTDSTALNRAVGNAMEFVNAGPTVAPLLAKAGIDQARLEQIIRAELGNKLAADPSVKVG